MRRELKVGLFIVGGLMVLLFATLNVRDFSLFESSGTEVTVQFSSAEGIRAKTPVELAGIEVGFVKKIRLIDSKVAELILHIRKGVELPKDTRVYLKSKGFLGETYLALVPGESTQMAAQGSALAQGGTVGDFNALAGQLSEIAVDVKAITAALRTNIEGDQSRMNRIFENIEMLSGNLASFTNRNSNDLDRIVENLALLTDDLRQVVGDNRPNLDETMTRLSSVAQKIDQGKGTLGKLVNDDATIDKLNDSLDSLNETLGSVNRLKTEVGYHTEYMGQSGDIKHYVGLALKPRPDKYFLLELVSDPSPSPKEVTEKRTVTSGGTTSTVITNTETTDLSDFRFSAELAKKFYDFTLRGGIIESTGGVGLNYDKGPVGIAFDAFDFQNKVNDNPHLKASGKINLTPNLYLLSGVDDFVSKTDNRDFFVGAGIQFVDEDIKALFGAMNLKP